MIAGAVTVVARHGRIAHIDAAGLADIATGRPMELDTIMQFQSMTKPITAVAAMTLFEDGCFLLDDPISEFIPELGEAKVFVGETAEGIQTAPLEQPITIRHLLLHTAGFTYGFYDDPVSRMYAAEQAPRRGESLADGVRHLATLPLAHQPGTRWTYGTSYDVLGRVVEVVAGKPFDVVLRERIFEPLGMVDTGYRVTAANRQRLAEVYRSNAQGGLQIAERAQDPMEQPLFLSGGSGLYSTANDYLRFCHMLLQGGRVESTQLLGRKTVALMLANHWPSERGAFPAQYLPPGLSYSFGGAIVQDMASTGLPASAGAYAWSGAYTTFFWIDPQEALVGLLLLQLVPMNGHLMDTFQVITYQALVA